MTSELNHVADFGLNNHTLLKIISKLAALQPVQFACVAGATRKEEENQNNKKENKVLCPPHPPSLRNT